MTPVPIDPAHTTPSGENVPSNTGAEGDAADPSASSSSSSKKKKSNKKKSKSSSSSSHPTSHLDATLLIPEGIKQHYFDAVKGKGLIATRDFREGEIVFEDEAFVAAPPMSQAKNVETGKLCNACFQPVDGMGANVGCKGSCQAMWCSRACETRGRTSHHNVMCKTNNPPIAVSLEGNRASRLWKFLTDAFVSLLPASPSWSFSAVIHTSHYIQSPGFTLASSFLIRPHLLLH